MYKAERLNQNALHFEPFKNVCNSIWLQNFTSLYSDFVFVLERCNSIWLQNKIFKFQSVHCVLERCNSIWLQNGEKTKPVCKTARQFWL